jgi:hypothetical protein
MYNEDSFNKHESAWQQFHKSCLGRIVILAAIILLLMLIAIVTRPSEEKIRKETRDNIIELIHDNDSSRQDQVENTFANLAYIFTSHDTLSEDTMWHTFNRFNTLEYRSHTLYSEMRLHNTIHVMGVNCALGFLGMVIPTIEYDDLLLWADIMKKEYQPQQVTISDPVDDYYFGEDPDLDLQYEDKW